MAVLLSLGMTMGLFSCGQKTASAVSDELAFDSIVKDTTVVLTHGTDTGRCTLHMSVLFAQGKNAQAVNDTLLSSGIFLNGFCDTALVGMTVQKAIDTYAQTFIDTWRRECEPLLKDGFSGPAATYSYEVSTSVQPGRDSTVTYLASSYLFTGGAHGTGVSLAMNFDTRSGRLLGLDDVFRHGYEVTTNRLIVERLLREQCVKDEAALKEMGIFDFCDVFTTGNFILGKDSITFIYQQDEVAPHAVGEIRVAIPYKDLDGVLRQ